MGAAAGEQRLADRGVEQRSGHTVNIPVRRHITPKDIDSIGFKEAVFA